ncbi:MAG: GNAT family N-acetyltransferase [Motiliproteus sp.]
MSSALSGYRIEPIHADQDPAIAAIIHAVGTEFGAIGDGFGPSDAEVGAMSRYYGCGQDLGSRYLVAMIAGRVVGGGGIAPFNGSRRICELRKLFLSPEARGLGIGQALTQQCLDFALAQGYQQCYLDTVASMTDAIALYHKLGFETLTEPLAGTPHGGCDVWMLRQL